MRKKMKELLSQMTLEEKAALCSGDTMFETKTIPRLGVPAIRMNDGPHGVRRQKGSQDFMGENESEVATCFPAACLTGCSFDTEVLEKMGHYLGQNAKAEEVDVLLGPGINIKRSPLCGRNFEYFSEDPYLSGELGSAYVNGLQAEGVGASLKHFLANNQETRRRTQSSELDERTLREIYASAFEAVVKKAKPWTVMASYNKIHGTYATENSDYLRKLLREEWGFDGMVVSDWAAVHDRIAAVIGGCNLTMPSDSTNDEKIVEAVKNGTLEEQLLDENVLEILELIDKCRQAKTVSSYDYEAAYKEAVQIASESMVLLKNEDSILPLDPQKNIVFIGRFAEETRYQGNGSSRVNPYRVSNMLEAAGVEASPNITYYEGFGFGQNPDAMKEREAVEAAKQADLAVIFAGTPETVESEGFDRWSMKLPICQNEMVEKVCAVQANTIVVLQNGGTIEMPWVEKPKAILESYLGGEGAAEAIWSILTGRTNPSGRLAETFPRRYEDSPAYLYWPGEGNRVEYSEGIFIGYRYYVSKKQDVLFHFGHGLSYTEFSYSNLQVKKGSSAEAESAATYCASDEIKVFVDVTNAGTLMGKEVVQLYVGVDLQSMDIRRPVRELKGFAKIELHPGETRTVEFTLDKRAFAIWDKDTHQFRVPGGDYFIQIGASANEILLEEKLTIENEYQEHGYAYGIMSPICDVLQHPAGKAFLDGIMPMVDALIARMPQAQNQEERPYAELLPKTTGLMSEPLQTIKRMLPQIKEEQWEELFTNMNNQKLKI